MNDARRYAVYPIQGQGQGHEFQSWKSVRFQKLSPPPFTMGAGN